ncbi:3-oxoacid CoA-transferase subunit B [Rhodococcus rhodochrous]|uniref:3-oxoacid CoA-transferase subunit B n=1 Tax=Rhodococcus rhodochrous TaxID=1829 RepID=UPI001E3A6439|nr:3-oxoacid CoA-transferase subunit B [Rhodococcus rhodochrous]MCD2100335.1 3-oxoacid CoA-transferase subunit B [Rhodococcus rhodochrous]MCD2124670.1 3-oxoacid CoA-transferase subunit B [Rhodococcus rhodochrous]MCQ4137993.1 3-oxoacid CoA-transferase subunit B [Rhodococcus rhodochrous]MDJ0021547.1 3-oxoacid CoA-transferase subunit B [Rhodococcus rhodochrous]
MSRWTRDEVAARVARDIPDGAYVNLGIGMPTMVADHVPAGRELVFHTENGMLGMGPAAVGDQIDEDLINAGKLYVTESVGCSYFHHADSFAMIRGGHIEYCVIGAYQVGSRGDLANWRTTSTDVIPGVGGAMDLAVGARNVYVCMDLFTKTGECKLVADCTYPLTAQGCVDRVYTDHGVFEPNGTGFTVVELSGAATLADIQSRCAVPLVAAL